MKSRIRFHSCGENSLEQSGPSTTVEQVEKCWEQSVPFHHETRVIGYQGR